MKVGRDFVSTVHQQWHSNCAYITANYSQTINPNPKNLHAKS